jgi:hypothetical protein
MERTDAAALRRIFERFKYFDPIDESARKNLAKSRKKVLKRALKEVKIYSLWYGLVLFCLLTARNFGLKPTILACKIAATATFIIATGAVLGGSYIAVKQYQSYRSSGINSSEQTTAEPAEPEPPVETEKQTNTRKTEMSGPIDEITLYSGRIYRGTILSRGQTYIVLTPQGKISIPNDQIMLIKRIKR